MARMEPQEVQEFTKQMKEAGEASLTHVALTVSVLAVLVAMVTVLGHRTHTEAVLMQARATDQWNEYQAKKIRFDQASVAMDLLSLQPSSNSAAVEKKIEEYRLHQDKWKDELAEEQKQARDFEAEVKVAERKAGRYDLGEALLQIGVVLCSITLFTRRRLYFFLGLALGAGGLLLAGAAVLVR